MWVQATSAKERKQETYYDALGKPLKRISFYVDESQRKVLDGPYEDITPLEISTEDYKDGKIVPGDKERKQETYYDALGKPLKRISFYVDESQHKVMDGPYEDIRRSGISTDEYKDGKIIKRSFHGSVTSF